MNTLIIPCAGRSTLDGKIKYLTKHPDGKLLIEKCYDGIKQLEFDRVIITILKQDDDIYNVHSILKEVFDNVDNFELCILDNPTSGPAETIYQTIKKMNVKYAVVVKDSDNYVYVSKCDYTNFVVGLNLFDYEPTVQNIKDKSFIIINEQNHILDIVEKQIKSDIICVGLYGIKRASDFLEAYESLSDKNYGIERLYVSHIISYLIGRRGYVYHYINAMDYENWETDKEWNIIQKKYATYFINFESVLSEDEWRNHAYDKNTDISLNLLMIEQIKVLTERGAKIVITTAHSDQFKTKILDLLNSVGVKPLDVICNCSYSIRTIINDKTYLKLCAVDVM